mgnify:CR=1 FL=1|jgi:hypothetical protein
MSKIINENIRFYKETDPYYWEVDNLPLQDLLANDKELEEAILTLAPQISGGKDNDLSKIKDGLASARRKGAKIRNLKGPTVQMIGREGFDDLLPYAGDGDGKVYVSPGIFEARAGHWPYYNQGLDEHDADTDPNRENDHLVTTGEKGEHRKRNESWHYPGRMETFQLLKEADLTNPSVLLSSFDAGAFANNSTAFPQYRIDLIGVAGDKDKPFLFVIEGAGLLSAQWEDRFKISASKGYIYADAWENDPVSTSHSGRTPKLSFNGITRTVGAAPLPSDLFNAAPGIVDSILQGDPSLKFGIPVCFVYVPAGHTAGDNITDNQIIDARPFFKSNELTLKERQAIAVADPHPNLTNPFITKAVTDSLSSEIDTVRDLIPDIPDFQDPTDYSFFGAIRMYRVSRSNGSNVHTDYASLPKGYYLAFINWEFSSDGVVCDIGVQAWSSAQNNTLLRMDGSPSHLSYRRNSDDDAHGTTTLDFEVKEANDNVRFNLTTSHSKCFGSMTNIKDAFIIRLS